MHIRHIFRRHNHSLATALPRTIWGSAPIPDEKVFVPPTFVGRPPNMPKYQSIPLDQPLPNMIDAATPSESSSSSPKPTCKFVKLDNGLRVVSIDRSGASSALGLLLHTGSRFEDEQTRGLSHLLELMAFRSTTQMTHLEQASVLEKLGAAVVCQASREHIMYRIEVLREYLPLAVEVILGNVLVPTFAEEELKESVDNIPQFLQIINENKEIIITDLLHKVAYNDRTVGRSQFAKSDVNAQLLKAFHRQQVQPENMIFVGVNCDHNELINSIQHSLGKISADISKDEKSTELVRGEQEKPVYQGGFLSVPSMEKMDLCHLAVAWHVDDGWNSEHLIPLTVLQMLLGGGDSFSTGGPGKGMHSRIYKRVLNEYSWIESCQTFSHAYSDSALFGFYAQMHPDRVDLFCSRVVIETLNALQSFTAEEVQRAKNALKSSIALNLEINCVVMEDIGRQVLMFDRVALTPDFHKLIDCVTSEDLTKAARSLLQCKPTMIQHGQITVQPNYNNFLAQCSNIKL